MYLVPEPKRHLEATYSEPALGQGEDFATTLERLNDTRILASAPVGAFYKKAMGEMMPVGRMTDGKLQRMPYGGSLLFLPGMPLRTVNDREGFVAARVDYLNHLFTNAPYLVGAQNEKALADIESDVATFEQQAKEYTASAEEARRQATSLDELQAAILRVLLPELAGWNDLRQAAAQRYADLGLDRFVELPGTAPGADPIYHLYVVRCQDRDAIQGALKAADVGCVVYYDTPHHLQPVFADLGYKEGSLPETERAARECLALPMYPTLPAGDQETLIAALEAASA